MDRLLQYTNIIATEIGCTSWTTGENPTFKYCCDEEGPSRPCYCESAARKILQLNKEQSNAQDSSQEKGIHIRKGETLAEALKRSFSRK